MKVIAIGGRGSRKDFVDLFFYLRGGGTLEGVFSLIRRRRGRLGRGAGRGLRDDERNWLSTSGVGLGWGIGACEGDGPDSTWHQEFNLAEQR